MADNSEENKIADGVADIDNLIESIQSLTIGKTDDSVADIASVADSTDCQKNDIIVADCADIPNNVSVTDSAIVTDSVSTIANNITQPKENKEETSKPMQQEAETNISINVIINKGTGAGGANTNISGKTFEHKTDNEDRLIYKGFERIVMDKKSKTSYYLYKKLGEDSDIVYCTQGGLKAYILKKFGKEICRHPDEAYLIRKGDKYTLKILEKKNQNGEGSVDTKLGCGSYFIEEYRECLGEGFEVEYAFCISNYLKENYLSSKLKWKTMRTILEKNNINVLFGEDEDYYEKLDAWIWNGV